jgi:putative membrane protein
MNNRQPANPARTSDPALAERRARIFIISASIAVPALVSLLYLMPKIEAGSARDLINQFPRINAILNGTTAVILVAALAAIRNRNIVLHRRLMTTALSFSVVFLVLYVCYHGTSESTAFPKDNPMRSFYVFILMSHIVLSAIVVPLVLVTYSRGLSQRYDRHRRIARITFPIWLYVALTGVIVYLMISPYYNF